MNRKDIKELKFDVLECYKQFASSLYMKWSKKCDNDELRFYFAKIILDHAWTKTHDALRNKIKRNRIKKIKKQIKKNLEVSAMNNEELKLEQFSNNDIDGLFDN